MRIPFLKLPLCGRTHRFACLSGIALCLLVVTKLPGQVKTDAYEGTWAVASKTSDPIIVILKPNGEASYFNVKNADRTVYQGQWSTLEGVATARWTDGSEHRFRRGSFDLAVTYRNPQGEEIKDLTAKAVPEGILGQWAKPPVRKDAEADEADATFFGLWEVTEPRDGKTVFVIVSKDRSAATNIGGSDASGLYGSWIKQGSELHLVWENGDYSILREVARGHNYTRIPAGLVIEDAPRDFKAITRTAEENAPADWLSTYKAHQAEAPAGYIFSSRKEARNFYRGDWLIEHEDGRYERITIRKYGGLDTSRDRNLNGDWLLSGQNVMLRWDDGMRKILSPAGRGFVYYSYLPSQPLDGVPTRIRPAILKEQEKLATLQTGRKAFGEALIVRAQAAGIQMDAQDKTGPMDWSWPFGRKPSETSEALLLGEGQTEEGLSSDPWWWPLWSDDTPKPDAGEKIETGALDPAPENTELEAETGPKPLRNKKGGWYWPF